MLFQNKAHAFPQKDSANAQKRIPLKEQEMFFRQNSIAKAANPPSLPEGLRNAPRTSFERTAMTTTITASYFPGFRHWQCGQNVEVRPATVRA